MDFPQFISFTVTNSCNLRCQMCGQWSEEGYIKNNAVNSAHPMHLSDWMRLVDEIASHKVRFILVRGGEPFLFPEIMGLLRYINNKRINLSIDTNGTLIQKYAAELARIDNMHITFSVDGPEEIHDSVRKAKGSYQKIKENIALLNKLEKACGNKISKSICFTISKYSYKGLGAMPDVAREMGILNMSIVPYYYFSEETGKKYEKELEKNFECSAFSWKGFHHEDSGIDFNIFKEEYNKYLATLGDVSNFLYMDLSEEDYRLWFSDSFSPVGSLACMNVEDLIDIQPDGEANFCVDFPDYSFGNAKDSSIEKMWNSTRAFKFRDLRRRKPLAICYRCGARYITEIKE